MKVSETDILENIDTMVLYYVTEVKEDGSVFAEKIPSAESIGQLHGKFKLSQLVFGEYDTLDEIIARQTEAKEIIIL